MIRAVFFEGENGRGFEISGHAGGKVHADISEQDGHLKFSVGEENDSAAAVLDGLKLHLTELSKQYPKKIKVITEV